MHDSAFDKTAEFLAELLARMARGDEAARDLIIERSAHRLEAIARWQLRSFPAVQRWEQTDDVLQGSLFRLHRALETARPNDAAGYFSLASAIIRRELIDLKRRLFGPEGFAAHHESPPDPSRRTGGGDGHRGSPVDAADDTHDPQRLARWTELHETVDALPEEQRILFDLLYYQELTHEQAAAALGVSTKTIQRRWREARLRLHHLLDDGEV